MGGGKELQTGLVYDSFKKADYKREEREQYRNLEDRDWLFSDSR